MLANALYYLFNSPSLVCSQDEIEVFCADINDGGYVCTTIPYLKESNVKKHNFFALSRPLRGGYIGCKDIHLIHSCPTNRSP